jgi:hypothetical protein
MQVQDATNRMPAQPAQPSGATQSPPPPPPPVEEKAPPPPPPAAQQQQAPEDGTGQSVDVRA